MREEGDIKSEKRALRRVLRQRLGNLDATLRQAEGAWVCRELLAMVEVQAAATVMAYWAMPNELPVDGFVEACVAQGKRVVLPEVVGDDLELHEYTGRECLREVPPYGILEPHGTPSVAPEEVEVVVVPGVAFDAAGGRLGHGKGFYDRLFPRMQQALLLGVCLSCQVVDRVPREAHDRLMDRVVAKGLEQR